jgi:hypothetical protein
MTYNKYTLHIFLLLFDKRILIFEKLYIYTRTNMSYNFYAELLERSKKDRELKLEYAATAAYEGIISADKLQSIFKIKKDDLRLALKKHFGMLYCSKCKDIHPVDRFWKNPNSKVGYRGKCSKSESDYDKSEAGRLRAKRCYEKHKDIPDYQIRRLMSQSIYYALNRDDGEGKKGISVMEVLPYTVEQLKEHLISTLPGGITWEQGKKLDYTRDHMLCATMFTPSNIHSRQIKDMEHFDNLTMITRSANSSKSDRLPSEQGSTSKGVLLRTIKRTHRHRCQRIGKDLYNFYAKPKDKYKKTHSDIDWTFQKVNGVYVKLK